jgi:uncharacterized low-complexity protein
MMKKHTYATAALSVCTSLIAGIGTANAGQSFDQSPFAMQDLGSGYMVAEHHEGKCGEGKCGGEKKAAEGKCGGEKKAAEGKCGEGKCGGEKKAAEGKCGEGKCGGKN